MPLSQYILDAREQYRLQVRLRNTWLIRLRWYYLLILSSVVVVASILSQNNPLRNQRLAIITCAVGVTANILLWLLTRSKKRPLYYYNCIAFLQILLDICLAASTVYFQEGLASRTTVLFALPILGAGVLFVSAFAYLAAVLSSLAYAGALIAYRTHHPAAYSLSQIVLPAAFYSVIFFFLAIIVAGYTARNALKEREASYAELLALLRHQLYHPSSVIAALVEMLEYSDHYKGWPVKDKTYLQQLKRENKRLHSMIANAMQAMTDEDTTEPGYSQIFDIVPVLNELAVSCATGAKRLNDLRTELPHKAIDVEGDPRQLSIALDNILDNAFRYTEAGTSVTVSAESRGYKVTVTVEDKGKGMSHEQQKSLFRLFSKLESRLMSEAEQARQLYDMGIGLYVSKLIIERHRGSLELISTPNQGTKVIITLYGRLL